MRSKDFGKERPNGGLAELSGKEGFLSSRRREDPKKAEDKVIRSMSDALHISQEWAEELYVENYSSKNLDFRVVVSDIMREYDCSETAAVNAISRYRRFAGPDHGRVMKDYKEVAALVGVPSVIVQRTLVQRPSLIKHSKENLLAALDVANELSKEGFPMDEKMLNAWLRCNVKSPYVPGKEHMSITEARAQGKYDENDPPPLMVAMRKSLNRMDERKKLERLRELKRNGKGIQGH